MEIVYTFHASIRMKERGINKQEVESCIIKPDTSKIEKDKITSFLKINGKVLVVVYKKLDNKLLVITLYKTSKTKKYSL